MLRSRRGNASINVFTSVEEGVLTSIDDDDGKVTKTSRFEKCVIFRLCYKVFLTIVITITVFLVARYLYIQSSTNRILVRGPTHYYSRPCFAPEYYTLEKEKRYWEHQKQQQKQEQGITWPKICLTTLTDESRADWWQRIVRYRDFSSLLNITWNNKVSYVQKYGYYLFDESSRSFDTSRPPSWSKIRAALRLLKEENCTWVLWLDADTVIMNSSISLESIIPATNTSYDLVIAHQKGTSWNAGVWLVRNSPWSIHFLETWYNMTDFVLPKGLKSSGDNAALKEYLMYRMPSDEYNIHVVTPSRCNLGSIIKFMPYEEYLLYNNNSNIGNYIFYQNQEVYHKYDFIAHMAGMDDKIRTAKILLEDAT